MADVTFTIGFKEDGTPVLRNIKREVEGVGTAADLAAKKASGGFRAMQQAALGLGAAMGGIGVIALAAKMVGLADTALLLEGRLKLVTSSTAELRQVQDALFASAQRARSSYEGTVDLYAQLARNAKGLGASQADLLRVTESVNKAIQISGTSAASAQAALVQLGQGFASGTLRGEELNSVLEQTPRLAEAIATGMGVTIGQLRKLGEEGKLTAEAVFDALKSQGRTINEEFGKLPTTVGQALTQLSNSMLRFVGTINEASGVTGHLVTALDNLRRIADAVREALRLPTVAEELHAITGEVGALDRKLKDLKSQGPISLFGQDLKEPWVWLSGEVPKTEKKLEGLRQKMGQLWDEMEGRDISKVSFWQISDASFLAAATGFEELLAKVKPLAKTQMDLKESMDKQLVTLKDQEAQARLTARAFIDYQAVQLKGKGHTDEEIKQWKTYSLSILATKEAKEAATKATRDAADATQKSAADARKAAADQKKAMEEEADIAEKVLDIRNDLRKDAEQRADANKTNLTQLNEEIAQLKEESQLLIAGLGPKAELLEIEKEIALARADRTTQTELLNAQEKQLNEENQKLIVTAGELRKANIETAASTGKLTESLKNALLTTHDLRDGFRDVIDSLVDGDWGGAMDAIERKGKELGVRLIEGLAFGKQGLENSVLIPNFSDLFGPGGIIGSIMGQGGYNLGATFINWFSQGASAVLGPIGGAISSGFSFFGLDLGTAVSVGGRALGSIFGSSMGAGAASGWQAATGGFNGSGFLFGGVGSMSGGGAAAGLGAAGTALGGLFGSWAGGKVAGAIGLTKSKEGKIGSMVGGAAGGIGGGLLGGAYLGATFGSFAGPIGTIVGAFLGAIAGAFGGNLFAPTTTSGTLIREGVEKFLKEIKASFAGKVSSKEYFFEETKALAKSMFGGNFLDASKEILTDKAGPELAKELQSIGTFLTANAANKLDKSAEQTGTTFGNMLIANLGIDEVPAALDEVVEKAGITFDNLTGKLTRVFEDGRISADFYKGTIEGAVSLFYGDLPDAIKVSELALKSFSETGAFDLEKFKGLVQAAVDQMTALGTAMSQALAQGIASGESRAQVEAAFENLFKSTLFDQIFQKFITDEMGKFFKDIDLTQPVDLSSAAFATLKDRVGDAYDNLVILLKELGLLPDALAESVNSADALVDKIRELQSTIREIANERIEIRLQLLDDLASIGLVTALEAVTARLESISGRITAITGAGRSARPLGDLSDADLTELIALQGQLRQAILSRYQQEAAAIQAAAQAQIVAIRAEYSARREAIQATISALQEQRTATQELFQKQIQALEEQLRVAEAFRNLVESINGMIRAAVQSPQSPLDPQQQQGSLAREAAALRARLTGATGAERTRLMQELAQVLQQQLSFVDRNTVNGQELFSNILRELTALRDAAGVEADKAARIQEQIAAATLAMDLALKSIDAQIAAQQALLTDLSRQEAVAIAAVEAAVNRQLEALRAETAQQLLDLARKTDEAKVEQLRRLEAQLETAREQLVKAVGTEEATRLLAAGDQAHLVIQAQQLSTLHSIDQHLIDAFNALKKGDNAAPANVASPSSSPSGGTAGGLTLNFSPVITVTVEPGEEGRVKTDMEEVMRLTELRMMRKLETDWAPRIKRIAEGGV